MTRRNPKLANRDFLARRTNAPRIHTCSCGEKLSGPPRHYYACPNRNPAPPPDGKPK